MKSTSGAENLSLVDAVETSFWIPCILAEIFHKDEALNQGTRNSECVADNRSLFEAVHSTTALADKTPCVDMAILRQMKTKGEVECINWIPRKAVGTFFDKKGCITSSIITCFRVWKDHTPSTLKDKQFKVFHKNEDTETSYQFF